MTNRSQKIMHLCSTKTEQEPADLRSHVAPRFKDLITPEVDPYRPDFPDSPEKENDERAFRARVHQQGNARFITRTQITSQRPLGDFNKDLWVNGGAGTNTSDGTTTRNKCSSTVTSASQFAGTQFTNKRLKAQESSREKQTKRKITFLEGEQQHNTSGTNPATSPGGDISSGLASSSDLGILSAILDENLGPVVAPATVRRVPVSPGNTDELSDEQNLTALSPIGTSTPKRGEVCTSPTREVVEETSGEADSMTPPKRRTRNPSEWKPKKSKKAQNFGLRHVSTRGKVVPARKLRSGCGSKCKKGCSKLMTEQQRQEIFTKFWALGDHSRQWLFIASRVKTSSVKRRTVVIEDDENGRRNHTNQYSFLVDTKIVQVCKTMFLATLDISRQFVATALQKKMRSGGAIPPDRRGRQHRRKGVNTIINENVKDHIKKFPRVPGHYTRKNSDFVYLDSGLNVRKMHKMYLIEREAEGFTDYTASLRQYRDVMRNYKIKFFKPKKDQCGECWSFKNKTAQEKTPEVVQAHDAHLRRRTISRASKKLDATRARADKKLCVATFDMQSVLPCPKGENSEFYYRSKLNCFNFTIFDCGNKQAYCYVWDQTVARRGSNEIASFLFDFVSERVEEGVKNFIFYSDNCYGQNKNGALFTLYHNLCQRLKITITHRYLEKGHTQMECDSIHAAIERRSRKMDIFTPSQWWVVIRMSKLSAPHYIVKEVTQNDIFDVKAQAKDLCWKKVPTSNLREIGFDWRKTGTASFRLQFGQESTLVSIDKNGSAVSSGIRKMNLAYTSLLPPRPRQLKDLAWLSDNHHVPQSAKPFYDNLKSWAAAGQVLDEVGDDWSLSDNSEIE